MLNIHACNYKLYYLMKQKYLKVDLGHFILLKKEKKREKKEFKRIFRMGNLY